MKAIIKKLESIISHGIEKAFGRYYSSYMGFVASTEDPKKYGRIQIILPFISDEPLQKWAWQKGRYSGKNYGSWNIPEKGSMVWVEFERGDLNYPIWDFGYHGKDELEEEWSNVNNKWFRTPDGFHIIWRKEEKELEIKLPDGNSLVINEDISLVSNKKISLGKLGQSDEPALLGNKTEKVLKDMKDALSDIKSLLAEVAIQDAAAATTYGFQFPAKYASTAIELGLKITSITAGIEEIKSNKVTLD